MAKILVTGRPGIGKTTLVLKVSEMLKERGVSVGGIITREVRRGGVRVGFEIIDVGSGRRGILAWAGRGSGPRVGKYTVNLSDLETVGVSSIINALEKCQVVVIDEIGPMELFSAKFRDAVWKAFTSEKTVLATIHIRADRYEFCRRLKRLPEVRIFELTLSNRDVLPMEIVKLIV